MLSAAGGASVAHSPLFTTRLNRMMKYLKCGGGGGGWGTGSGRNGGAKCLR